VEATYEFRLLGPLEALVDDVRLELGGPRQRAVLELLLLRANEVVPRERLIDELWGEAPPPAARETLKVYVGRLRKFFPAEGPLPRLVTRGGGYSLELEPEQLDLHRFRWLTEAGSHALADASAEAAAALLREALALWRGTPLADVSEAAFADAERDRLEELRLAALEQRVEADLALGHERDLVGELERLVIEHPFREHLRAQLMLVLYRRGRQVEALAHYRRAAKLFVDELGIEPGPELRERERAILEHDPSLRLVRLAEPNLPLPPNRLIGRDRALAELLALLDEPETRLVTLVGTGGAGKTRLALEVAHRLAAAQSTPVYFVDLAPLAEPRSVVPAIARTVGSEDAAAPLVESLARLLGRRPVLLLLDNFEHVIEAAADVAQLLAAVPGIRVLATSRRPLRIRAEWRYELGPLRSDDAVALFVERVRAIRRGFEATETVQQVCRRLDGLPLSIELAAARVDRIAPDAMLEALDRRFDFLAGGARDLPRRQRTLRAALDWSYALLDEPARELLARLGVFAGGCDLEAAESVCGATSAAIDALTGAAFVRRQGKRILMLETIREYALDLLRTAGGEQVLRRSHARYYAELVEKARSTLGHAETIARVTAEDDNIRDALRWTQGTDEIDLHLRLAVAIAPFWSMRGQLHEADSWLRPAVAAAAAAAPALRASVLTAAASFAARIGDATAATGLAMQAWELFRACGDHRGAAAALFTATTAVARAGDRSHSAELLEQLDAATRELADPVLRAGTLRAFGATVARAGGHERGRALAEESLAIARAADLELDVGQALCHLGIIALQAGRTQDAREPLEQSLAIAYKLTYREAAAYSLSGLASLAVAEEELPRAAELLAAADALFHEIGTTRLPFISDLDARTRAAVIESVGADVFTRTHDATSNGTFEDVIASALGGAIAAQAQASQAKA
jgi:predicted ATPase/DNA-binding SARP family transcriptional activator